MRCECAFGLGDTEQLAAKGVAGRASGKHFLDETALFLVTLSARASLDFGAY